MFEKKKEETTKEIVDKLIKKNEGRFFMKIVGRMETEMLDVFYEVG